MSNSVTDIRELTSPTLAQCPHATVSNDYTIDTRKTKRVKLRSSPEQLNRSHSLAVSVEKNKLLRRGASCDDKAKADRQHGIGSQNASDNVSQNSVDLGFHSVDLSADLGFPCEPETDLKRKVSDAQMDPRKPEKDIEASKSDIVYRPGSLRMASPEVSEPSKRPDLESILKQIRDGSLLTADTPIMTDTLVKNNLMRIIIPNVTLLQEFAGQMKDDKKFKLLKTRPIVLKVKNNFGASSIGCETRSMREQKQIESEIETEVVLKVFLNGTARATDQFVSVCLSAVNKSIRQNVLEEQWLIVCVFIKQPNSDEKPYRKDFKMKFSPALEQGEKGILEFITKKDFNKFVSNEDSVTMGISLVLLQ